MLDALREAMFKVLVLGTGHAALWAVTLGRWKSTNAGDAAAAVTGILVWIAVVACIVFLG